MSKDDKKKLKNKKPQTNAFVDNKKVMRIKYTVRSAKTVNNSLIILDFVKNRVSFVLETGE